MSPSRFLTSHALLFLAVMLAFGTTGCGKKDGIAGKEGNQENPKNHKGIAGKYINEANPKNYLELKSDGTYFMEYPASLGGSWIGKYDIEGNQIRSEERRVGKE